MNATAKKITGAGGDVYFEPASGKGTYYIYYMPYKNEGRTNYPRGVYLAAVETASSEWLNTIDYDAVPNATAKEIQAINAFSSNYPMEVTATRAETEALLKKNPAKPFLVFPTMNIRAHEKQAAWVHQVLPMRLPVMRQEVNVQLSAPCFANN